MVELFEQNIRTNTRQSSKGNQLKWENESIWYKADYTGYEGLAEYVISHLLKYTNLNEDEYVLYEPEQIKYKRQIYNGVRSRAFIDEDWQIITLERLFKNVYNESLTSVLWHMSDVKERLVFLVNAINGSAKVIQEESDEAWVDLFQTGNPYKIDYTNNFNFHCFPQKEFLSD